MTDSDNSLRMGPGGHQISRITSSDTHITIGDMVFERADFTRAFGGSLNVGPRPPPSRKFADPAPIGLASFAVTILSLSLVNIEARGATNPAALAGLMFFFAGFVEVLGGMWGVVVENTFAATAQASYGAFWMMNGVIVTDVFGLAEIYGEKLPSALGMIYLGWAIYSVLMWIITLRSTWPLSAMLFFVVLNLIFTAGVQFTHIAHPEISRALNKTGGYSGLITAFLSFWNMYEGLCTRENSYWQPPLLLMPGAVIAHSRDEDDL